MDTTREMAAGATRYFLFVGESGSCLGGMQDYYGAYGEPRAAQAAIPAGVDWAELATVRDGRLVVVATGRRRGPTWLWEDLDGTATLLAVSDRLQDVA
jgi:hypothetical protein